MALGAQFLQLQQDLRDELGRSNDVNIGVDDLDQLKRVINRVYRELYDAHDWPHLRKVFDPITLTDGQRYYDFPDGLDYERVECVNVWYSGLPHRIHRGIGFEEYASYDSDSGEKSEPTLAWDVRWSTASAPQFEVWPIPSSSTQTIQFIGLQEAPKLVADIDRCRLDDELVTLFAAAKFLRRQGSDDADMVASEAQSRLKILKGRTNTGGSTMTRVGLGPVDTESPRHRAVVRVR